MKRMSSMLAAVMLLVSSCFLFEKTPDIEFEGGVTPQVSFDKAGGQSSVQFNATAEWTAESSESWCVVSPVSGEAGDITLTVRAAANDTPDGRSAVVRLSCGEVEKTITVDQAQKDMVMLSVPSLEIGEEGGDFPVAVSCNVPLSGRVLKGDAWIAYVGTKAMHSEQHLIRVQANDTEDARTGEIEFYNVEAGVSARLTVSQQAPAVFELSDSEVSMSYEGGSFSVTVRSSLAYSISSTPSWVKEISSKAVATKVHTFEVEANPDQAERSDVIVFCNETGVCVPLMVMQEAAPEPGPSGLDWTKDFAHKSLIMRFTATWCGYCPIMAETVAMAQASRPGRYELVNIHGGGSDLEFSQYRTLLNEYNIGGYPTAVIDGRRMLQNYTPSYGKTLVEQFQDETESTYPVCSAIGVQSAFTDSELSVDVDVYCKAADSYKLTVLVLEDGIIGYQSGAGSDYHHDAVARIALTDVKGDAFSTVEENTAKQFSFKTAVPSGYKKENLRVLVYVFREFGNQKKLSDYKGSFYVDNAASVKAGETLEPAVK